MENKEKIIMRDKAINCIDLIHYSPTPYSNGVLAAYEFAGYVMQLTNDVFEETNKYRDEKLKERLKTLKPHQS